MASAVEEMRPEPAPFNAVESELVTRALAQIGRVCPEDAKVLRGQIARLRDLLVLLWDIPSLRAPHVLGDEVRDESTLVDHMCSSDGLSGDLELPLKATLSRTFLLAKIQCFGGFVRAVNELSRRGHDLGTLGRSLRDEHAQSIYTQLAEELLLALLRKPDVELRIKRLAATQLITVWDDAQLEIDDFCPMLESSWHARNRIAADLGSLLGTTEYFRLVCEDCSPQFLDFFVREDVSEGEKQAFEEFLFGMTYEELGALRSAMRAQGLSAVTAEWAGQVLKRTIEHQCRLDEIDPMSLYRSYFRRQLAADFRIMAGAEGPRRTAEAYLMIYLLDQQLEQAGR
ncbi:MAG TPA: hypothetical protein VFG83_11080 [Kofleriaceae bacterium]|nr:hypothetical protein [Kofleriaceae bacterium]